MASSLSRVALALTAANRWTTSPSLRDKIPEYVLLVLAEKHWSSCLIERPVAAMIAARLVWLVLPCNLPGDSACYCWGRVAARNHTPLLLRHRFGVVHIDSLRTTFQALREERCSVGDWRDRRTSIHPRRIPDMKGDKVRSLFCLLRLQMLSIFKEDA